MASSRHKQCYEFRVVFVSYILLYLGFLGWSYDQNPPSFVSIQNSSICMVLASSSQFFYCWFFSRERHIYNCKCWNDIVYLFLLFKFIEMLKLEILYLLNDSKKTPNCSLAVHYIYNFGKCVWIFHFNSKFVLMLLTIVKFAYGRASGGEHSLN